MNFTSPIFFGFVFATVLAFHLSSNLSYRRAVLSIASLTLVASYSTTWLQLLPLTTFLVLGYLLMWLVSRSRTGPSLAFGLAILLIVYIFLKQFFFLQAYSLPFVYTVVGLSYILFRIIHLIVDVSSGEIESIPSPLEFFRYTCNFLCFVSGPIQTWDEFRKDDASLSSPLNSEIVFNAFSRVATGLVKVAVIAAVANYLYENVSVQILQPEQVETGIRLFAKYSFSAASYTAYLYYNFSGYMDIVLGIGLVLGQKLPENFDRPFIAASFLEFWQRWHITLSLWFKAYVFTPLMLVLVRLFPSPGATAYVGVLCFFVTFLLMGVWHGSTIVFVIYGLLMGLGASVNKLWQVAMAALMGKKEYRVIQNNWLYAELCRGLTFAYFTMALTCLWVTSLDQFGLLADRLGAVGIATSLLALTLGFACLFRPYQFLQQCVSNVMLRLRLRSAPAENLLLASRLMLVLFCIVLLNKTPEFVYKAF
jgi:D-alanyl-lipoteichoic acid acyltransferase DltB (MBOAT superfamily)